MFHALAWQTTSRSRGLTKSDRSQNVARQRLEAERGEEALAVARHLGRGDAPGAQDRRQVHRARASRRRHVVVQVRPVLRPDVAEQMRGDRTVGRDHIAVALAQPGADVGVQREVQRPQLLPQPIELLRERVGRHVVLRAPHRAGVGESQLAGALVGQLDEPRVALLHRRRDRVPALPHLAQARRVAVLGEDLGDLLDVQAGVARLAAGAVLAAAVHAVHRRHELRQFGGLFRIGRRRHREDVLEHRQLAPLVRGQLDAVELRRALREAGSRRHEGLAGAGVHGLGVHGDERLLHPAGAWRPRSPAAASCRWRPSGTRVRPRPGAGPAWIRRRQGRTR